MTYNVFSGTLNPTQSINMLVLAVCLVENCLAFCVFFWFSS